MSRLEDVGERDGWRCWLCDEAVDPAMSVNDDRGPSIDSRSPKPKPGVPERLAHRGCNTRKGAVTAVVPWPEDLFVSDPAVILTSVERLQRKGGREIMARCVTKSDAGAASSWLADRLTRLAPDTPFTTEVDPGGGQFMVVLRVGGR